jgi:hypothetical protein
MAPFTMIGRSPRVSAALPLGLVATIAQQPPRCSRYRTARQAERIATLASLA